MSRVLSLLPALITAAVVLAAVLNGVDVMGAMTDGARRGMKTAADMLPALTVLFAAIYLLRASALPEMFARLAAPVLSRLGIPEETALLLLLRPLSGSGALGADSLPGRTAAVMLSSSETTFYVIAVYFGAARVRSTRWAIPAALFADAVSFAAAAWVCRAIWG